MDVGMLQRNTIRDIDTGQVYVLDTEDDSGGALDLPKNSAGYTDVVSGNKMTAEEFDRALGLAGVLGVSMLSCEYPFQGASAQCAPPWLMRI